MAHASSTITINRPIREVFDYIADGRNNVHWRANIVLAEPTSDKTGEGATYRQLIQGPLGRWQRIPFGYRITVCSAPHELAYKQTRGAARPSGNFRLSEAGPHSTVVEFTINWQPKSPIGRMIDSMLEGQLQVDTDGLQKLKQILEPTGVSKPDQQFHII